MNKLKDNIQIKEDEEMEIDLLDLFPFSDPSGSASAGGSAGRWNYKVFDHAEIYRYIQTVYGVGIE